MYIADPKWSDTPTTDSSLQQRDIDTDLQALFTAILNQSDIQGFRSLEKDQQTDDYRQQLLIELGPRTEEWVGSSPDSAMLIGDANAAAQTSGGTANVDSADSTSASEEITQLWQQWVSTKGAPRYQEVRNSQQHTENFGQVLIRAKNEKAYVAPNAFLSELSKEELQSVQKVHGLAEAIEPDSLTYEGALNLLLPPSAQVDYDHNGLTESGAAQTLRFPDSQTSTKVVNAWDQATAELPEHEKMLRVLQMKVGVLLSNLHRDPRSGSVTQIEPGDPRFTNPYSNPSFSYQNEVSQRLESLEYFKAQTPADQYQRDRKFWTGFLQSLRQHDAS